MCTRHCYNKLNAFDVLELLSLRLPLNEYGREIRRHCLYPLKIIGDQDFLCLIPHLVFGLRYELSEETQLLDILIQRSIVEARTRSSIHILNQIYANLIVYKSFDELYLPFPSLSLGLIKAWGRKLSMIN